MSAPQVHERSRLMWRAGSAPFGAGASVGALGGLIGLGGAEFRLPLLITLFRFSPLEAVILNKAMSLVVVASALIFRLKAIPLDAVAPHLHIAANLLAGSLVGAWFGAAWATRLHTRTLFRVIAALLACLSVVLLFTRSHTAPLAHSLQGPSLWIAGAVAGVVIGGVASLLGVAGGELLIPTLVLLFGVDIKLAGSLSLAVSLPTMLVGFARYSRDQSFAVLRRNRAFVALMAGGSIVGAAVGGLLVGQAPAAVLYPILGAVLAFSAIKVWRHPQ